MTATLQTISLPALPGLTRREREEPGTAAELVALAHRNGWDAAALALVIEAESGWDPNAQGPGKTEAQGLNQLTRKNRRVLGLPASIRSWGARKQLRRAVEPYFKRTLRGQKPADTWQYFAANFIGTPEGEAGKPLRDGRGELVPGNPSYDANKAVFDPEGRGWIGPEHLSAVLEAQQKKARGTLSIRMSRARTSGWKILGGAGIAAGAVLGVRWLARRLAQ